MSDSEQLPPRMSIPNARCPNDPNPIAQTTLPRSRRQLYWGVKSSARHAGAEWTGWCGETLVRLASRTVPAAQTAQRMIYKSRASTGYLEPSSLSKRHLPTTHLHIPSLQYLVQASTNHSPWATAAVLLPVPATADPTAAATAALYVLPYASAL